MRKMLIVALCVLVFASLAMAQTWTQGATSTLTGVDKLGAHQNGGRGCAGCHAPHSGARGNGGNAANAPVKDANNNILWGQNPDTITDSATGNYALWGQDLSPLYNQKLYTGDITKDANNVIIDSKSYPISFAATFGAEEEQVATGVMMCLSCHDGNLAKGAMMANALYEQKIGLLPPGYGNQKIPTLLGNDGTSTGNYANDHPIGPYANLKAVGLASSPADPTKDRVVLDANCPTSSATVPCIRVNTAVTDYQTFVQHYGSFNVTMKLPTKDANNNPINNNYDIAGGRAEPLVIPTGALDASSAYVVCTTCHTPHSMYVYSGNAGTGTSVTTSQVLPSYFFIAAPYNPGAPIDTGKKASSATQFCRQCHFTGAGGSNEGSGILTVTTSY